MSFKPLQKIINKLQQQPEWENQRVYQDIVSCWSQIVTGEAAKHSRPVNLARQTLWVATANSVWAQSLSWQKLSILKNLETIAPHRVGKIYFSSAHWGKRGVSVASETDQSRHPSALGPLTWEIPSNPPTNPEAALASWKAKIEKRNKNLPLCPSCQAPTPPGEINRWGVCAYCVSKEWS